MLTSEYSIVIPARYASTRFPGKPLHPINGKPMILHTACRALESSASQVVVATDDQRIADVCLQAGLDVQMTDSTHPSGTDRIAEVANVRKWQDDMIIVGLQGDEPATPARHLDDLAYNLQQHTDADMATLCNAMAEPADYLNPNRVKVVRDRHDMALYFSRAPIPASRDCLIHQQTLTEATMPSAFLHIGLYAYRCHYLRNYHQLPPCEFEKQEELEQLRVLYDGGRIHVGTVQKGPARGVDQLSDVPMLETLLKEEFAG